MRVVSNRGYKYQSNYSILLDDLLISIFEIESVGLFEINFKFDYDEYNNLTYDNGNIFTKDFKFKYL